VKIYKISDILDSIEPVQHYIGIFEETPDPDIEWPHRHNFYSIVWFTQGKGLNVIDFEEYEICPQRIFTTNPRQIHNWEYSAETQGYFILMETSFAQQYNIDFSTPYQDIDKEEISFAQTYFAVQTRKAEIVEQRLLEYERVRAREKLSQTEKQLSGILYERGVDDKGFAIIRSKGDQALFNLTTAQLKRKIGAPDNRPVADFLPTISIKAKDLAAEMTSVNVVGKDLKGMSPIQKEHIDNNTAVRNMLIDRGIAPEQLPPAEDIKKVQRKLNKEEKKLLKNI